MPKTPTPTKKRPELSHADVKKIETADAVISRIVGANGQVKKGKLHELPLVSAVFESTEEMNTAISLLTEGHRLRDEIKAREDGYYVGDTRTPGLKDVKEELIGICAGTDIPGFRLAGKAVLVLTQTRTSFKKDKLVEALMQAGVDVDVIGSAMKAAEVEGDPFYVVKLEELS